VLRTQRNASLMLGVEKKNELTDKRNSEAGDTIFYQ
jgi:hypothetical protein